MNKSLPSLRFKNNKVLIFVLVWIAFILFLGIYAPFIASSKPFCVYYKGEFYFPFFRALFYSNIYTKSLDLFFNAFMFTLPLTCLSLWRFQKKKKWIITLFVLLHSLISFYSMDFKVLETEYPYTQIDQALTALDLERSSLLKLDHNDFGLSFSLQPPIPFHWEENVLDVTNKDFLLRINGQPLIPAMLFGLRYSFSIAFLTCALAFTIGSSIGAISGYFGGKIDLFISRIIEVWESMPTLVVVLLLVSYTKEAHFFFVSFVLALFSWTSIARLVRIEMIKQKHLCYVQVLKNMEISKWRILFKHLLPNSYWSLLSLLPNALIGAVTYESALSFLGLGDRSSCSLGLLIDEARISYPFDPQIFWPPALLLIAILVPLAWLGDVLREKISS